MVPMRYLSVLLAALAIASGAAAEDTYEIGPGDILRVLVLGQTEMSAQMPVDPEGMLTFPILGKVKASDMSARDLERKLTTLLADGYLKRPEVSVTIAEYRSQRVYVTGEVARPGIYALKSDRSLLALLGEVGSPTASAGHEVLVIRPPHGGRLPPASEPTPETTPEAGAEAGRAEPTPTPGAETIHVGLADLRAGKPEANILLQLGDTIHVPRASQVYVSGQVARPGAYRYESGATVLQMLTVAGGVTPRGSSGRVKIVRVVAGKRQEVKVKSTDPVQPEDTIVVPERFF
jgi:polysaccharide biosynthesis/export protein